jgi:hypothetical protein
MSSTTGDVPHAGCVVLTAIPGPARARAAMRRSRLLCALGCIAAAACGQAPEPPSRSQGAVRTSDVAIPLHPYFRDLRVVRARVGADTLTLLLDTGGGATLITPQVARDRGCSPHGSDVGHRMSGEPVVFARCDSLRIELEAWSVTLSPVAVFDVNALLPKELPQLDGVLALDAFRGQVLTLHWPEGSLLIRGTDSADSALANSGVAVRVATGESGRFLTALARVAGTREPLWFLLDSGNLRGTLVSRFVLRDSLLPLDSPQRALLAVGGRAPLAVPFAPADLILDGALGLDYLQRGAVTLDLRGMERPQ